MIDHIYEVDFLFPDDFQNSKLTLPRLRIPEIPLVNDRISFDEVTVDNGNFAEFIVSARHFHLRRGEIAIATLSLEKGGAEGVAIQKTS